MTGLRKICLTVVSDDNSVHRAVENCMPYSVASSMMKVASLSLLMKPLVMMIRVSVLCRGLMRTSSMQLRPAMVRKKLNYSSVGISCTWAIV